MVIGGGCADSKQRIHPSKRQEELRHSTSWGLQAAGSVGFALQRSSGCTAVAPSKHRSKQQSALLGVSMDLVPWPKSEPGLPYAFCGLPEH